MQDVSFLSIAQFNLAANRKTRELTRAHFGGEGTHNQSVMFEKTRDPEKLKDLHH